MICRLAVLFPAAALAAFLLAGCPDFYEDIPCDSDDNCPRGYYCVKGVCGKTDDYDCLSNLDCPDGSVCDVEKRRCGKAEKK